MDMFITEEERRKEKRRILRKIFTFIGIVLIILILIFTQVL